MVKENYISMGEVMFPVEIVTSWEKIVLGPVVVKGQVKMDCLQSSTRQDNDINIIAGRFEAYGTAYITIIALRMLQLA